jgi:hypothetical protein
MASTVRDCQRIIDACRQNRVKLQLGHMKRFMRGNQRVKAIVDSGAMGKIYMAECRWTCAVPQLVGTYRNHDVTINEIDIGAMRGSNSFYKTQYSVTFENPKKSYCI